MSSAEWIRPQTDLALPALMVLAAWDSMACLFAAFSVETCCDPLIRGLSGMLALGPILLMFLQQLDDRQFPFPFEFPLAVA
jgi:hypothetical protein